MVSKTEEAIFRKGSRTYYFASKFFPQPFRDDVFTLYAFVRVADDLVDTLPPQKEAFTQFEKETLRALKTGKSNKPIIERFVRLAQRKKFRTQDVKAFLGAMRSDTQPKIFKDFKDVDRYIYGSAEVIGIFMNRIFNISASLDKQARLLGRAMQYINWLRDIADDNKMRRAYIPRVVLKQYGLQSVQEKEARAKPDAFVTMMRAELQRQYEWHSGAAKSFPYLPRCMRVPVMTATDSYLWTARKIRKNPFVVFRKKVKPSKLVLASILVKNWVKSWMSKPC